MTTTAEPTVISGQDYSYVMALAMMRVMRRHKIQPIMIRSPMQFESVFWYRVAKEIIGLPGRRNKRERDLASRYIQQVLIRCGQKTLIDFKDSQLAAETNLQIIRPKIIRKPTDKYLRALKLVDRCIKLADKREHVIDKSSNPFWSSVTYQCQHQGLDIYVRGQSSPHSNGSLTVQVRKNKCLVLSTYGPYMGGQPEIKRFVRGPWEDLIL